jgi:hypothetical protein
MSAEQSNEVIEPTTRELINHMRVCSGGEEWANLKEKLRYDLGWISQTQHKVCKIGPNDVHMENLARDYRRCLPEEYKGVIEKWCEENSSETIKYILKNHERCSFAWTSESFDFTIFVHNTTVEDDCPTLVKVYLIDSFSAPTKDGLDKGADANYYLTHPTIIQALCSKLFTRSTLGNGIELKSKYRQTSLFDPFLDQSTPIPLNNDMIQAIERDYYFNRTFVMENKDGSKFSVPVVYRPLGVYPDSSEDSLIDRLNNLVKVDMFDLEPHTGAYGSGYVDTLLRWLSTNPMVEKDNCVIAVMVWEIRFFDFLEKLFLVVMFAQELSFLEIFS